MRRRERAACPALLMMLALVLPAGRALANGDGPTARPGRSKGPEEAKPPNAGAAADTLAQAASQTQDALPSSDTAAPTPQRTTPARARRNAPPPEPQEVTALAEESEAMALSDALCGGASPERGRAEALDRLALAKASHEWRATKLGEIDAWLQAPPCRSGTAAARAQYNKRQATLRTIRAQTEIDAALALDGFFQEARDWQHPPAVRWPADCESCTTLERTFSVVAGAATQWQSTGPDVSLGWWIEHGPAQMSAVHDLCRAKPPHGTAAHFISEFAFYWWTSRGQALVKAAAWFERAGAALGCPR